MERSIDAEVSCRRDGCVCVDKAIYNIEPSSFKCKRRISYETIGDIKLSKLPDNFFAVHVPSEYDYLFVGAPGLARPHAHPSNRIIGICQENRGDHKINGML